MQIKSVQSWEEFESEIQNLIQYREKLENGHIKPDNWIFRGQRNSDWHLETTLERATKKEFYSIQRYFRLIKTVKNKINIIRTSSFIDWKVLDLPEYSNWFEYRNFLYLHGLLNYMIYLRHHGFPSPILDWTKSIDVAAYFAFNDVVEAKSISIFAFLNHTAGIKGGWLAEPNIAKISPSNQLEDTLDKRHLIQESSYTYCSIEDQNQYASHEKVFLGNRRHRFPQDILWKFIIPASEKDKVLENLEYKQINTASLFNTQVPNKEAEEFKSIFEKLDKESLED